MNTLRAFGVIVAATALSAFFAGCYTQVESAREGRDYGYSSESNPDYSTGGQAAYDTSVVDSGNYGDNGYDQARRDFYNDCGSPSVSVGPSWYNPWWNVGFGFGYDPWYWGGPVWYPAYGYPAYWGWGPVATPYYGYYGYHGYHGYPGYYASSRWNGARRTFGVTRTFGSQGVYGVGSNRGSSVYRTSATGSLGGTRRDVTRATVNTLPTRSRSVTVGRAASTTTRQGAVRSMARGNSRGFYKGAQGRSRPAPSFNRGGTRGSRRSYAPAPAGRSGGSSAPSGGRGASGGGRGSSGGGRGRR